ncbi:MAG: hypothetical protein ACTSVV_07515 [Promethearchaeota archaeon]
MARSSKKTLHFYNESGSLENVIGFLEGVQKKVNFINLNITVEGKSIKINIFGPRDIQYLACDKLRDLAFEFLR